MNENNGADQLRGDLCLCFHIMQEAGFLMTRLTFSYCKAKGL